jgi:hypothetical protein
MLWNSIYMSNYKAYLRREPTFDEITGYLYTGQERIKYPDRRYTFLRDTPQMGVFDDYGTQELQQQEQDIEKEKMKQFTARRLASEQGITHAPPPKETPSQMTEESDTFYSPRGGGYKDEPSTQSIFRNVRRRFTSKTPDPDSQAVALADEIQRERDETQIQIYEQRSKMRDVASSALALTGTAVSHTAGALTTVAKKGLETLVLEPVQIYKEMVGHVAEEWKNLGEKTMDLARVAGPPILNAGMAVGKAAIKGLDNFAYNMELNARDLIGLSFNNMTMFMKASKPTFQMLANAIQEGMNAYQNTAGPGSEYQRALPPSDNTFALGGGSSLSSSSRPQSYGPGAPPPTHGTGIISYDTEDEWLKNGGHRGNLYDQLTKRPGYRQFLGIATASGHNVSGDTKIIKQKVMKMSREDMIKIILMLDGKLRN